MNKYDPKYGHIVGSVKCKVKDCQGEKSESSSTIHYLYETFYSNGRNGLEILAKEVGFSNEKIIVLSSGKLRKEVAKAVGIRFYSAMTADELTSAIRASKVKDTDALLVLEQRAELRAKKKIAKMKGTAKSGDK